MFLLHWLWIYCITIFQLQAFMFMLLHWVAPIHTTFEYSQVKNKWECVLFYFLHKMHVWSQWIPTLLNLSQVCNLPWIGSQVTNNHFGGTWLIHVIFLQLTLTKLPLKALYIRLIEKLTCWKTLPLTLEKVIAQSKTFFYYPWNLWWYFH